MTLYIWGSISVGGSFKQSKSVRTIAHGESNARNTFEGKRLRTDFGWLDFSVGLNRILGNFDTGFE